MFGRKVIQTTKDDRTMCGAGNLFWHQNTNTLLIQVVINKTRNTSFLVRAISAHVLFEQIGVTLLRSMPGTTIWCQYDLMGFQ